MLAHARETHPEECCGAVRRAGGRDVVRRFTNVQGRLHRERPGDASARRGAPPTRPSRRSSSRRCATADAPGGALKVVLPLAHRGRRVLLGRGPGARDVRRRAARIPTSPTSSSPTAAQPGEARAFRWDEARARLRRGADRGGEAERARSTSAHDARRRAPALLRDERVGRRASSTAAELRALAALGDGRDRPQDGHRPSRSSTRVPLAPQPGLRQARCRSCASWRRRGAPPVIAEHRRRDRRRVRDPGARLRRGGRGARSR